MLHICVRKDVRDGQNEIMLPCFLQEVELYLWQIVLLTAAVITEIMERGEMQTVNGFVALFAPTGFFPCAIRPLVDTALDLTTTSTTRQHPG